MDAADAAGELQDAAEGGSGDLKTPGALTIAILAMLLAITSLGGDDATKTTINANIQASDTWAFYQAKNIRQTDYRLAAEQMEVFIPSLPPEQARLARERADSYKATVARYESEPDPKAPDDPTKGEGKKELLARAQLHEAQRDRAQKQDPNFDYATALFQIAIVLGSVAIVSSRRPVLLLSQIMGVIALVLSVNGFFLLFELPG